MEYVLIVYWCSIITCIIALVGVLQWGLSSCQITIKDTICVLVISCIPWVNTIITISAALMLLIYKIVRLKVWDSDVMNKPICDILDKENSKP